MRVAFKIIWTPNLGNEEGSARAATSIYADKHLFGNDHLNRSMMAVLDSTGAMFVSGHKSPDTYRSIYWRKCELWGNLSRGDYISAPLRDLERIEGQRERKS